MHFLLKKNHITMGIKFLIFFLIFIFFILVQISRWIYMCYVDIIIWYSDVLNWFVWSTDILVWYLNNKSSFFERCRLITATIFEYILNNARYENLFSHTNAIMRLHLWKQNFKKPTIIYCWYLHLKTLFIIYLWYIFIYILILWVSTN